MIFVVTLPEVCNFANGNTIYSSNKKSEIVFRNLESDLNVLVWLNINSLKANPGKFKFVVLGTKEADSFVLNIGKNKIESSTEVTLLGVKIDKQLKFKSHIEELWRKAVINYMLRMRRVRKYMTGEKAKLRANAFINSQFTYASLIWIFVGKSSIAKICKIHCRAIQIVYKNYDKSYHDLLKFSNNVSIHQKHL